VADDNRQQPVAIRVTRPFATVDEFLEHELETLTRTSVTLIGAQPRPKGVILRFEVALSSGGQLLRGEGRVVGFKENALGGQPGLVLRFTRLDTKSKSLVDRAAAIRESRARAALQAAMGEESLPPSTPPSIGPSSVGPVIGPMSVIATPSRNGRSSAPPPQPMQAPPPAPSSATALFDEDTFSAPPATPERIPPVPPSSPTIAEAPPVTHKGLPGGIPDANRETLLERLRARGRGLSPDRLNALVRR
jgi:hypothetical protein